MKGTDVLAIDLGGTNCRAALVALDGTVRAERRAATPRGGEGRALLDFLVSFCQNATAIETVAGIAIGVPALVDDSGQVSLAPNLPALTSLPLASALRERLKLPVAVVNDANAAAWGEYRFGSGQGLAPLLVVTLGTGVGGGLILKDELWHGAAGTAGEIGHLMVEAQGRPCGCGSRGCLETYASVSGILRTVAEELAGGALSSLAQTQSFDGALVAAAASAGDPVAGKAFKLAGQKLGQALAMVVNLLSPRGLVVTGGGSASLDLLLPSITTELRTRANPAALAALTIKRGILGDQAALLGAAELGRRTLFH